MPADIVIRGGTVVDGSGAPGSGRRRRNRRRRDRARSARTCDGATRSSTRRAASSRPGSSTSTRTTTRRCSGTRRCGRRRTTASPRWSPGNCGFTIAPTRPEHHDVIVRTLENVEDMDGASLTAGIVWDFQTYPEYLELVRRRGTALNFTAYVGHSSVRLYVMGDAAYERAATPDEIDADVPRSSPKAIDVRRGRVLHQLRLHPPRRRREAGAQPVRRRATRSPRCSSRPAGPARAWCSPPPASSAPTPTCTSTRRASGGRSRTRCSRSPTGATQPQLALHEAALARGAQVCPQVTPRPLTMQFTMESPFSLNVEHGVRRPDGPATATPASPRTAIPTGGRGPPPISSRSRCGRAGRPARSPSPTRFPELEGRRVDELARRARLRPARRDLRGRARGRSRSTRFRIYIANDDVDERERPARRTSRSRSGLSDAGAHVGQLCDAPLPTDLLGTWVREREVDAARAGGAQAERRARRHVRVRAPRLPACGCLGRRVRVRPGHGRHRPDAAGARLPGRRRAPDRRGADGRAARLGQRHAHPPRRYAARRAPTCVRVPDPRSPDRGEGCQRTVRKKVRRSSTNSSGCSMAAKCPPRGMTAQWVTL